MDRTLRATLLAAFIGFAAVAGIGVFLGFEVVGSLITGAVIGVLAGALIWGAARRAESFAEVPRPPVTPGFPGPPEPASDEPSDVASDRSSGPSASDQPASDQPASGQPASDEPSGDDHDPADDVDTGGHPPRERPDMG